MSAVDMAWAVILACWCASTYLLGLCVYELHRGEFTVSRRAAQALSVSALGAAAALTSLVLNLTT